jgi:hypothetical protein
MLNIFPRNSSAGEAQRAIRLIIGVAPEGKRRKNPPIERWKKAWPKLCLSGVLMVLTVSVESNQFD